MQAATSPNERAIERQRKWPAAFEPLPGSEPYENVRPMFVGGRHDHKSLGDYLSETHPHIGLDVWRRRAADDRLLVDGRAADLQTRVRGGSRVEHVIPDTVEPPVASGLRFVFEDDDILVVSKPAPLPVHPSGRFNRHTVVGLYQHVFGEALRPVHRLDASVSGLMVLARNKASARELGRQFEARTIDKRYLAGCQNDAGLQPAARRTIDAAIARGPRGTAGLRRLEEDGLAARTQIEVIGIRGSTALVLARPISGRTNQLRLHLAHAGLPIIGDSTYGMEAPEGAALRLHAHRLAFDHPRSGARVEWIDERPSWC